MLRWGQLPTVVSRGSGRFRVCGNEMFYRTTLTCVRRFVVPPPPAAHLKCCLLSAGLLPVGRSGDLTARGCCLRGRGEPTLGSFLCRKGGRFLSST